MIQVQNITSEVAIREHFTGDFKKYGTINQMAFFLGAGAEIYYDPDKVGSGNKYDYPKIAQLIAKELTKNKDSKIAVVSLGCGNCQKDKIILEYVQEMGYKISFFGVDSSTAMLHKANSVLSDATFEKHLIFVDFGALNFKKELDKITEDYDLKIYLFLGNTFGNLPQSYIANMLKNLLHPRDYLLLDVCGFETITPLIQAKMFKKFREFFKNPPDAEFYLHPIKTLEIPVDCGRLVLDATKDNATQAQIFTFGFKIGTLTDFYLEEDELTLSPNEYIQLGNIFIYDLKELVKFLRTKKFILKDQLVGEFMNQLLLQRK